MDSLHLSTLKIFGKFDEHKTLYWRDRAAGSPQGVSKGKHSWQEAGDVMLGPGVSWSASSWAYRKEDTPAGGRVCAHHDLSLPSHLSHSGDLIPTLHFWRSGGTTGCTQQAINAM